MDRVQPLRASWQQVACFQSESTGVYILKSGLTFTCINFIYLCTCTCAVGSSAVNVIVGFPLLSNLVGVDEYNQHCNQTDEGHQHSCRQGSIDVWDEAPRGGMDSMSDFFFLLQCM